MAGPRVVSVQLEKVQVQVLAQRIGQILTELDRRGVAEVVKMAEAAPDDERPLDEPLRDEFGVGTLTIGWDTDDSVLVLEARSESDEEADDEEVDDEAADGPDVMRVRLSAAQAAGSSSAPRGCSRPAGRRARSAASRSIRRATSVRGPTAT